MESNGKIDANEAIALVTTNLNKALGFKSNSFDLVGYEGGDVFNFESKVKVVLSPLRGVVDLF